MENNTTLGKGTSYNPYKTADKHYFGGYFNLAINNIENVIAEFNKRLGRKETKIENLKTVFTENMSLVDYERYIRILDEYFPIIRHLDKTHFKVHDTVKEVSKEERITYFIDNFISLLDLTNKLRNFYTHYYHDSITIEESIFDFLDESLLTTVRDTKENYLKTDKTKQILSISLKEELEILCSDKLKYLKENKIKFSRNDKDALINAVYNDAFKNFLYKKGEHFHLTDYKKTKILNPDKLEKDFNLGLSTSGIVYLLSFFLNRKELELFKGNIKGFKASVIKGTSDFEKNSIHFMATHRIYSVHCYRGLKKKIRSSNHDTKQVLLMQMLDELSKVPHVIYNSLDKELKDTFVEDWNEYFKDNEENNENLENSRVIHPVIRKRYEDKFNYFALRFLDNCVAFPTLRFQVHVGDYVHHKMEKSLIDSKIISERIIKEKVTVFARLDEVNKAKADYFNSLQTENDNRWEFFPNPSYDFPKQNTDKIMGNAKQKNAEKIGIYIQLKNNSLIQQTADAKEKLNPNKRSDTKLRKQEIIEKIINLNTNSKSNTPIVHTGEPVAYLSTHDLHSILYDLLVKGETAQAVEIKIQKQIEKQLREIVDKDTSVKILKKYNKEQTFSNINFSKLQNDLVKERDNLISLIDEHDYRIEDYERTKKQRNYPHKRTYILYAAEKGKIAVWLADDIKRFMPKDFKEQWKGYQHSELQKILAYYETNHKLIAELLRGLDIENLPFDLNNCLKKNTLEDFYPMYLEKRIGYISQLIEQIKNFKDEPKLLKKVLNECFKFLKEKNYKQCELNEQVQRLLAMPVFIERGFLDDKPTMKPNISFDDNKEDFAEWFVYYKSNNNYQKFYDVEFYPFLYNDKKELYKIQTKIKRQQKNDFFTLLMSKALFTEIFREEAHFTLSELFQSREERLQNAQNAKETQERNLNFIWNKVVNLNLVNGKINISDVKLKDIGNFKAYETDKRVLSFLEYESDKQWLAYLPNNVSKENTALYVIECQLQNYEKVRAHQLFKEVQKLEQYIYHKVENKEILKYKGNQNFRNYLLYGLYNRDLSQEFVVLKNENFEKISIKEIREKAKNLEQQLFILTYIRNKFAHNQMPNKEFYDFCQEIVPCENMKQFYGDYYLMVFRSIVNEYKLTYIH